MEAEINEVINTSAKQGLKVRFDKYESCLHYSIKLENKTIRLSVFLYDYPSTRPSFWTEQEDSLSKSLVEKLNSAEKISKLIEFTNLLIEILKKDQKLPENEIEIKDNIQQKPQIEDEIGISDGESSDDSIHESHDLNEIESDEIKILKLDLEEAKTISGADQIKYIPKLFILRVSIDVSFLSPFYADALGIDETIPITIEFEFTQHYTSFGSIPIIELWQVKQKSFGLQFQLREILTTFLREHWDHYKEIIKERLKKGKDWETERQEIIKRRKTNLKSNKNKPKKTENESNTQVNQQMILELIDCGFDMNSAIGALIVSNNNQETAMNLLLENPVQFQTIGESYLLEQENSKNEKTDEYFQEYDNFDDNLNFQNDPFLANSQLQEVNLETFVPTHNLIADIVNYMTARVQNCMNYCVICDKKHKIEGLKPIPCESTHCLFRYEEIGLGISVASEIKKRPDVVDLLITIGYSAATSGRNAMIFDPFPTDFMENDKCDYSELVKAFNSLPSVEEMSKYSNDERDLRAFLETSCHKNSYRLLRWLITSNRAHLIKIPVFAKIKDFKSDSQFLLLSGPPQKEAKFQNLKKQYPSVFAFHGSPTENWHSILRKGLKNMSNTRFMLHAAAMGAGIYLAEQPSVSLSFGRRGNGWPKSRFAGKDFNCIAICEIIKSPEVKDPRPYYVIANEDLVMTRCFILNLQESSVNRDELSKQVISLYENLGKKSDQWFN
ncbi:poly adp-ribose polymerase family member parp [Anaeramoeba ignava]|uniref:Poly adp-ribose polymerase family member parp n=1 Tax=Anaeramoeba ignava TaxID=1746090 RepID=A0A9Q0LNC5_ANAIG|nr:poly adp-ribose polymerase family member parp [Anaeramoeba ignava]